MGVYLICLCISIPLILKVEDTRLTAVTISQYTQISNYVVHLKLIHRYMSIIPQLKKERFSVKVGCVNNHFYFSEVSGGFHNILLKSLIAV